MKYTLMHKQIAVAGIDIDNATGSIQKINKLYSPEHLPVGVLVRQGNADRAALNQWLNSGKPFRHRRGAGIYEYFQSEAASRALSRIKSVRSILDIA